MAMAAMDLFKCTRDVKLLVVQHVLLSFIYGYFAVFFNIYLYEVGVSPLVIGLIVSCMYLLTTLSAVPLAVIADRRGRKPVIILGLVLHNLAFAIYALSQSIAALLIASALLGISMGALYDPWIAFVADKTPPRDRDRIFSIASFASGIAAGVGAIFGGVPDMLPRLYGIGRDLAYRFMFALSVILGTASILVILPVRDTIEERREKAARVRRGILMESRRVVLAFVIVYLLIGFGDGILVPLFNLWCRLKFGTSLYTLGVLFAAVDIVMAFSYLSALFLSKRMGLVRCVLSTYAVAVSLLLLLPFIHNFLVVAILYTLEVMLLTLPYPLMLSLLTTLTRQEERASASSITGIAWSGANAVAPMIMGYLIEKESFALPFFLCSAFYGGAALLFYLFFSGMRSRGTDGQSASEHRSVENGEQ